MPGPRAGQPLRILRVGWTPPRGVVHHPKGDIAHWEGTWISLHCCVAPSGTATIQSDWRRAAIYPARRLCEQGGSYENSRRANPPGAPSFVDGTKLRQHKTGALVAPTMELSAGRAVPVLRVLPDRVSASLAKYRYPVCGRSLGTAQRLRPSERNGRSIATYDTAAAAAETTKTSHISLICRFFPWKMMTQCQR